MLQFVSGISEYAHLCNTQLVRSHSGYRRNYVNMNSDICVNKWITKGNEVGLRADFLFNMKQRKSFVKFIMLRKQLITIINYKVLNTRYQMLFIK